MSTRVHPVWPKLRLLALLAPGLGVILVLIGAVAWIALAQSFGLHNPMGEDRLTLDHWEKMLDRRLYLRAVGYSLWLGFAAALISVALAYPLAIWLRRPFRGSALVSAVLQAPLLVHGLVAAFLFVNIIAYHGLVNQLMVALGVWAEPRQLQNDRNAWGVLILQVWKNLPFALLVLSGSVRAIGDDILDAARDLGAGAFARFRRVILPLSLSALQAALTIVFIGALADYSFQVIAGPTNAQSLAQLMVFSRARSWHEAAVVGVTLMVLSLLGAALIAVLSRALRLRGVL